MQALRAHERLAIDMLLAGDHDVLVKLRRQASVALVSNRTCSAAGERVDFALPPHVEPVSPADLVLQDIELQFEGIADGAAILLYVEQGRLSFLEFATCGVEWPAEPKARGACYLREVQAQPGTYCLEPVAVRDQPTLDRALLGRARTGAA